VESWDDGDLRDQRKVLISDLNGGNGIQRSNDRDYWNEEYDRGKAKKVKHRRDDEQSNGFGNPFQITQNERLFNHTRLK